MFRLPGARPDPLGGVFVNRDRVQDDSSDYALSIWRREGSESILCLFVTGGAVLGVARGRRARRLASELPAQPTGVNSRRSGKGGESVATVGSKVCYFWDHDGLSVEFLGCAI